MRKILITLITGLFFFIGNINSQLTVNMSSVTVDQNEQASVDITVSGFTNLVGVQFSINFDSLVLQYVNATNFTPALPGLSAAAVSGPNGVGVKNGQITFSWFDQAGTGKSLPNGTRLFTLVFTGIGNPGTKSDVFTSNVPRVIEIIQIVNGNLTEIALINNKGVVTIDGNGPVDPCPNPTCSNPNSLFLSGAIKNAKPGDIVCIPISVKNFIMIQSGQGSFTWNPALLKYIEYKVPPTGGIPMFDGGFNTSNTAIGQFGFLWSNPTPGTPLTLLDNTVIIELCFEVVGPLGQTGCIIMGQGTIPSEWTNNTTEVPVCFSYGRVNIKTDPAKTVIIKTGSFIGASLNNTVCVDITVDSFTNILGVQTKFSWDPAKLEFVRTDMYNLEGLSSLNFAMTSSTLSFLWTSPSNPISKPNGHKIFQICFKVLGPCPSTSDILMPGPTEVVGDGSIVLPSTTIPGAISCIVGDPDPECTTGAIVSVDCNGGSNGSIAMTVVDATTDCTCLWKLGNTIVKAAGPVAAGCNLTGVPAGTYTFELSCGGVIECTNTATITQPTAISIPTTGVVTNGLCGQKGSINISATSGGTPPYTYNWTPNLGNTANPTNLDSGQYTVTVSDSKNCTATASYTVQNLVSNIVIQSSVTNVGCGVKGTITLTVTGGTSPFNYVWTPNLGNIPNPTNLDAGQYSVTVTDANQCSASASNITIGNNQTELLVTSSATNVKCKGDSSGSILLSINGGCPPSSITWSGGLLGANPQNVKAGTYTVTVTDTSVPVQTKTLSVTVTEPATSVDISVTNITGTTGGNNNGSITLTITGGTPNYKAVWSGGTSPDGNTSGILTVNNLAPGTYSVTVTDANGCSSVRGGIIITDPPADDVAPVIGTATITSSFNGFGVACNGDATGSIKVTLSAGTYPVTATLKRGTQTLQSIVVNGPDIVFNNLVAGSYTVDVTNTKGSASSTALVITQPSKLSASAPKINCTDKNNATGSIEILLNNTGNSPYTFNWFGLNATDNLVEDLAEDVYNVTVTDANGCEIKISNIEVRECSISGACYVATIIISPNGDNLNDIFVINCVQDNPSDLSVFDRWGRVVYSQSNYDNTWQGIDNSGNELKEGAYLWVLTVNFGQGRREVYKGTVTLLRTR
ncbi:MAG: gliding motility-associated C-terminal domain-containing protein [Saprospiraceae bacterium]|nr:gliding motility-associated C-terminal domain-containing protein [Saprospiraceae bacterium]